MLEKSQSLRSNGHNWVSTNTDKPSENIFHSIPFAIQRSLDTQELIRYSVVCQSHPCAIETQFPQHQAEQRSLKLETYQQQLPIRHETNHEEAGYLHGGE